MFRLTVAFFATVHIRILEFEVLDVITFISSAVVAKNATTAKPDELF